MLRSLHNRVGTAVRASCRAVLLFTFRVRSKSDYEEMIEDLTEHRQKAHERSHDEDGKVTDEKLKKIEGLYRQRISATKKVMNKCEPGNELVMVCGSSLSSHGLSYRTACWSINRLPAGLSLDLALSLSLDLSLNCLFYYLLSLRLIPSHALLSVSLSLA